MRNLRLVGALALAALASSGLPSAARAAGAPAPAFEPGARLCLAANTFATSFRAADPVHIAVALASSSDKPQLLTTPWRYSVRVIDANGEMLLGPPGDDPPPPPADHFLRMDGKRVFVTPVKSLPPWSARATVVKDALRGYKLKRGRYTVQLNVTVAFYTAQEVIEREDKPGTKWVRPRAGVDQLTVRSNPIVIDVQ